jgi:hypothetical protein
MIPRDPAFARLARQLAARAAIRAADEPEGLAA